jgi:hypothetical protein
MIRAHNHDAIPASSLYNDGLLTYYENTDPAYPPLSNG